MVGTIPFEISIINLPEDFLTACQKVIQINLLLHNIKITKSTFRDYYIVNHDHLTNYLFVSIKYIFWQLVKKLTLYILRFVRKFGRFDTNFILFFEIISHTLLRVI
jgi:hypothetical protein